jgi:hypothetical protein
MGGLKANTREAVSPFVAPDASGAAGRIRVALAWLLGALAMAALVGFAAILATRKSEVELLIEVLKGNNRADAAWAFEKLKEVSAGDLRELVAHVDDPAPTPLNHLEWGGGPAWHNGSEPFSLGHVSRSVLAVRLGVSNDTGSTQWAGEIARFEKTHTTRDGFPLEPRPATRGFLVAPEVVPPSRLPDLAALAAGHDARGLLEVVRSGPTAEAAWAVEVLSGLPDEALDALIPEAGSEAQTAAHHIALRNGRHISSSQELLTGEVVQFFFRARIGDHPQSMLYGQELERLIAAWRQRRAAVLAK